MFLLNAKDIKKSFGSQLVLNFDQLSIYEGDRIGVVGDNGSGKTTLLRILAGELQPDSGSVIRNGSVSFLQQFSKDESTLSGGEKRKAQVLELSQSRKHILFADEPTANLDKKGQQWVQDILTQAPTIVLISHDRSLLDSLCTLIIEVADGKLTHYTGNYSDYVNAKELEREDKQQAYDEYRSTQKQLKQAIVAKEQQQARLNQSLKRKSVSEVRLMGLKYDHVQKKLGVEEKMLKRRLDRLDEASYDKEPYQLKIDFSKTNPPRNPVVISSEDYSFSYKNTPIFKNTRFAINGGEKLAIVGENGSGKTTLLNEIYRGSDNIHIVPRLKIGYLRQDFSDLDFNKTVLENALETSVQTMDTVYAVLAGLLFTKEEVHKKAGVLSGGERTRLALAKLVVSPVNALLLDEPTNYLDIRSMESLEGILKDYPGTIILVSHDASFVDRVATRKLEIKDYQLEPPVRRKSSKQVNKLALELRLTQVVSLLDSTSPQEKTKLEQEYAQITKQLRQ